MLSCHNIANYFLSLTEEDVGDGISNLKLQKLTYYAYGFYLALYGTPLFNEKLEAWTYGPVIPELYHKYKEHGSKPIPITYLESIKSELSNEIKELLNEIYMIYGQYSAWKLRDLTHEELPWINANKSQNKLISDIDMLNYFKTLLTNDDK